MERLNLTKHPNKSLLKRLKSIALERENNSCSICNSDKSLQLFHKSHENWGEESLNDVTILCKKCKEGVLRAHKPFPKCIYCKKNNLVTEPDDEMDYFCYNCSAFFNEELRDFKIDYQFKSSMLNKLLDEKKIQREYKILILQNGELSEFEEVILKNQFYEKKLCRYLCSIKNQIMERKEKNKSNKTIKQKIKQEQLFEKEEEELEELRNNFLSEDKRSKNDYCWYMESKDNQDDGVKFLMEEIEQDFDN